MDDTPEVIRKQMDETKLQLVEKLESLEQQVTQTVQSTSTAVHATVASVQETVESVTGTVQDVVHSVSNALNLQRQFDRHPWLILGGAAVLGYLAAKLLTEPEPASAQSPATASPPSPFAAASTHENRVPGMNSPWHQLRNAALGSILGIVQQVASRATPHVLDYLAGKPASVPPGQPAVSAINAVPPSGNGVRQRLDSV